MEMQATDGTNDDGETAAGASQPASADPSADTPSPAPAASSSSSSSAPAMSAAALTKRRAREVERRRRRARQCFAKYRQRLCASEFAAQSWALATAPAAQAGLPAEPDLPLSSLAVVAGAASWSGPGRALGRSSEVGTGARTLAAASSWVRSGVALAACGLSSDDVRLAELAEPEGGAAGAAEGDAGASLGPTWWVGGDVIGVAGVERAAVSRAAEGLALPPHCPLVVVVGRGLVTALTDAEADAAARPGAASEGGPVTCLGRLAACGAVLLLGSLSGPGGEDEGAGDSDGSRDEGGLPKRPALRADVGAGARGEGRGAPSLSDLRRAAAAEGRGLVVVAEGEACAGGPAAALWGECRGDPAGCLAATLPSAAPTGCPVLPAALATWAAAWDEALRWECRAEAARASAQGAARVARAGDGGSAGRDDPGGGSACDGPGAEADGAGSALEWRFHEACASACRHDSAREGAVSCRVLLAPLDLRAGVAELTAVLASLRSPLALPGHSAAGVLGPGSDPPDAAALAASLAHLDPMALLESGVLAWTGAAAALVDGTLARAAPGGASTAGVKAALVDSARRQAAAARPGTVLVPGQNGGTAEAAVAAAVVGAAARAIGLACEAEP